MKIISDQAQMTEYLKDESAYAGSADRICLPKRREEVVAILKDHPGEHFTVQGSRTGLTGGCVPERQTGGIVLCMERMNAVLEDVRTCPDGPQGNLITVQAGMKLCHLREHLRQKGMFFPPDPTEATASIGGMINCNSSGALSYRYGSIRPYVKALDIILPDGDSLYLERDRDRFRGNFFSLRTEQGRTLQGTFPAVNVPLIKKCTAGYYFRPDMDLVDLFIGAEGTLGIVVSATLHVLPARKRVWGGVLFFDEEGKAVSFAETVKESGISLEAVEFFGKDCLSMIRRDQDAGEALYDLPSLRSDMNCGIYVETAGQYSGELTERYRRIGRIMKECGGDPGHSWAAVSSVDLDRLKRFRHAAPVAVNRRIRMIRCSCPGITKLGTDMSVPDEKLKEVFRMYRQDLSEGKYCASVFGHIGDGHLHVNIIPADMDEYDRGKRLIRHWAREIARVGGAVSAEHGIGKLKKWLLWEQYSLEEIQSLSALREVFDPQHQLNAGNLF